MRSIQRFFYQSPLPCNDRSHAIWEKGSLVYAHIFLLHFFLVDNFDLYINVYGSIFIIKLGIVNGFQCSLNGYDYDENDDYDNDEGIKKMM